jgi:glycosyltransferase involved in cell wall biosynthesis
MAEVLLSKGHRVSLFVKSSVDYNEPFLNKARAFFSGLYSFQSKKQLRELLDSVAVDLVQVQNLYPFLSPSIFIPCKEKKIPVVMRCPNYRIFCPNGLHFTNGQVCERCLRGREWQCILQNCENNYLKSIGYALRNAGARLSGRIVNNVDLFVVLSEFQKRRFVDGGINPERIEILPNFISDSDISAHDSAAGESIAFVGRVSPEKGIAQFLEAARNLKDYRFAVAGRSNKMPGIENSASSNVKFFGFFNGNRLDDFFKRIRVLVFPCAWFEGFPNVIAKAMACGKPVVASRIGALPEIVDDGVTGLLFEPGNAADLAEKIQYLWERPQLCKEMGHAGLEKARRDYSQQRSYERLMAIYEKARQLA